MLSKTVRAERFHQASVRLVQYPTPIYQQLSRSSRRLTDSIKSRSLPPKWQTTMMGRQSQQQSRDDSKDDQHRRLLFEDLWRIRKSNGEYPDHAMKPGETLSGTVAAARKSASTRFHNIQDAFTSSTQTAKEYIGKRGRTLLARGSLAIQFKRIFANCV